MTKDWQPIDTAPKDGTRILVYSQSLYWLVAFFGGDHDRPGHLSQWRSAWDAEWLARTPTHWMPLPDPPSA